MSAVNNDGNLLPGTKHLAIRIAAWARAGVDLDLRIHHVAIQYTGMPSVAAAKSFWRRSRSRVVRETATNLGGLGNDAQGRTITAGS